MEFQRNRERYEFLRWGQKAFRNFRVVPPARGHRPSGESRVSGQSASSCGKDDAGPVALPDTLVGTDSHTTMINGLGVVGWGVGGIEAEAVMLGQPLYMLLPEVVGFELTGELPPGATATDLVLTVTQILRKEGVVGKFVEFFGPGVGEHEGGRSGHDRQHGARVRRHDGLLPRRRANAALICRETGRTDAEVELVERYAKEQQLFRSIADGRRRPSRSTPRCCTLDLATVEPSLAGPKRPQDRVPLRRREAVVPPGAAAAAEASAASRCPTSKPRTHGHVSTTATADDRPRRRGDRRDHQLHEHEQSRRDARRRTAGQEGRRARAEGQAVREDQPRARAAAW